MSAKSATKASLNQEASNSICTFIAVNGEQVNNNFEQFLISSYRPYKCNFCDRAFTQGKTLKFHLRRHTEEKPFVCNECNSTFRQRDGLKRHLKSRHNIELKFERNNQLSDRIVAFVNDNADTKSNDTPETIGIEGSKKD